MLWYLLLAHFIADYPLQTDWIVQAKRHLPGLTLHVGIHLFTMMTVVLAAGGVGALADLWPYLLLLAALHFGIDAFKNEMSNTRPQWVIGSYLGDQGLHLLAALLVAVIAQANGVALHPRMVMFADVAVILTGYVLVTQVWFITERILYYRNPELVAEINRQVVARLITRLMLFTSFIASVLGNQYLIAGFTLGVVLPPLLGIFSRRALLTDVAVTLIVTIVIELARAV